MEPTTHKESPQAGSVDRPARHHADQMRVVFGAGVDVRVEALVGDRDDSDAARSEPARERRLPVLPMPLDLK